VASGHFALSPASENFGSVMVGSNQSVSETVTNAGGSSLTISPVGVGGSGFTVTRITAPVTLTAGQSTSFSVTFTPQSVANASGSVTITSNALTPTLTIPLSGTRVAPGALGSNPTSLVFGSVTVGSKQALWRRSPIRAVRASPFLRSGQGDWIHRDWDHGSGNTDGREERDVQCHLQPTVGRKCEWQFHNYFECFEFDFDHSFVGHRSRAWGTGIQSEQVWPSAA
jgi:hypothetical protein